MTQAVEGASSANAADRVEREIDRTAGRAWSIVRKHPVLGGILGAGVLLTAAAAIGTTEAALAVAGGWAAYRLLRKRRERAEQREST